MGWEFCDGLSEKAISYFGHGVGKEDLFSQADCEAGEPFANVGEGLGSGFDLFIDIVIADDRACDELREEGDVKGVVGEAGGGAYGGTVDVDQVGEFLEGEE